MEKPIYQKWLDRVIYDVDTAEAMLVTKRYIYVVFMCQQAIEKCLKSLMASKEIEIIPVHNLRRLAELIGLDKEISKEGSTLLVLPQEIVEKLGLRRLKKVIVTYADERKEERDVAGVVTLTIGDRSANLDCVVSPPLSEPLIGQIALEEMDLAVDCKDQMLKPRPESPRLPLLKCK